MSSSLPLHQPLLRRSKRGHISISSRGNITESKELLPQRPKKSRRTKRRRRLASTSWVLALAVLTLSLIVLGLSLFLFWYLAVSGENASSREYIGVTSILRQGSLPKDTEKNTQFQVSNRNTNRHSKNHEDQVYNLWKMQLEEMDQAILQNKPFHRPNNVTWKNGKSPHHNQYHSPHGPFFRVSRRHVNMSWKQEWEALKKVSSGKDEQYTHQTDMVDYTHNRLYEYPPLHLHPPHPNSNNGSFGYPPLQPLQRIFEQWPQHQDLLQDNLHTIQEQLQHFDVQNETQLQAAELYRNLQLPFKLTHVHELQAASHKWTDEYVSQQFDVPESNHTKQIRPQGKAQESSSSFFIYYDTHKWNIEEMGLPPTRNNDWTFQEWAQHANYANIANLSPQQPHFYWQAMVPKEERFVDAQSFLSQDLPSFSSPNATFVCPTPDLQNGIQCRFGEKGVVTANHYDDGQNMVGMIYGAKRYILFPPNQCALLGIHTNREHPLFRHSSTNYGMMDSAPFQNAMAVQTVLKQGELLFIPSFWFHYIIGLQKSAQCNVRSGVVENAGVWGGAADVSTHTCRDVGYENTAVA